MNNFYEKIWENTKDWRIEPFIFLLGLLTLNINYMLYIFYFIGLVVYFYNDEKFRGKYMKKFLLKSLLTGIFFIAIIIIIWCVAFFFMAFDDAGVLTDDDREFIFMKINMIGIMLKVLYSYISASICQTQKKLAHEEKK